MTVEAEFTMLVQDIHRPIAAIWPMAAPALVSSFPDGLVSELPGMYRASAASPDGPEVLFVVLWLEELGPQLTRVHLSAVVNAAWTGYQEKPERMVYNNFVALINRAEVPPPARGADAHPFTGR
ncbi:hypothetical protein [Stackebrandtia soli]|uniref:hypothetical protein n=1 Tax=Stackebrandtia soli TaxID=1892856 RepID=UPI0039EA28F7